MFGKKNLYIVDYLIGENKEKSYSKKNIFKKIYHSKNVSARLKSNFFITLRNEYKKNW